MNFTSEIEFITEKIRSAYKTYAECGASSVMQKSHFDLVTDIDINIEKYSSWMYVELKGALSFEHYTGNKLAFCVDKNGQLFAVDNKTKSTVGNALTVLELDKWYNIKVSFDIKAEEADIYIDGTRVGSLPVNNDVFGGISIVQIADASASLPAGLTAYIDNFRAYEGTSFTLCSEDEETEATSTITVKTSREEGTKPYIGEDYSSIATMYIYKDSTKAELVKTVELEGADTAASEFTSELTLAYGGYYAEVVKNGYLTYKTEIVCDSDGISLGEITLIPGDIKGSYDDESGDGVVDSDDFVRVLKGFAEDALDTLRKVVDINEDGHVNVTDLALVKANLGKKSE